jgi:hypothetical protein
MNSKLEYIKENLAIINEMIENNLPKFEIARNLGVKYDTLNKNLKLLGIEYAGNPNRKGIKHEEGRISVYEYLGTNKFITAPKLRNKLIEEGVKEEACERCGNKMWMGEKIPLELHHINGNHYDNRLENLQILCSNCHMQVHRYSNTKHKE